MSGMAMCAVAREMETAGKAGDLDTVGSLFPVLQKKHEALHKELDALTNA